MQVVDVMKRTGLSRKAIYVYEEKGLLSPAKVPAGEQREYRQYTESDVQRLKLIAELRTLNLSIVDIEKIIHGEKADIVLQNHLKKQQESVAELIQNMDKVSKLLVALPPNANIKNLEISLPKIVPEINISANNNINELISTGYARRVAMLLFEAFIDVPFDTEERWDAWYSLIEEIEASIAPDMLAAYSEIYGVLSTEQLCEDYNLRRNLVCSYKDYTHEDEQCKAEEIYNELKKLLLNENDFLRWQVFFKRIVNSQNLTPLTSSYVEKLSSIFSIYNEHFLSMMENSLIPLLNLPEGVLIKELLVKKMNGENMFDYIGLIYFDFYNHTLKKVLYK